MALKCLEISRERFSLKRKVEDSVQECDSPVTEPHQVVDGACHAAPIVAVDRRHISVGAGGVDGHQRYTKPAQPLHQRWILPVQYEQTIDIQAVELPAWS